MARSLNGGEPTPKPIKPLRYRIDPTAEKLDVLDNLERELERSNAKGMPPELYFELLEKLQADRAGIIARRDKGKPKEEPDYNAMPFYPSPPKRTLIRYWLASNVTDRTFKWLLFIIILFWFYCKNKA